MNFTAFGKLLKDAVMAWSDDKAARLGAALAFYTMFSLAPLLLIVMGIAGFIFGKENAQHQMVGQLDRLVGSQGSQAVESMLESASKPGSGVIGMVFGTVMLLLGQRREGY